MEEVQEIAVTVDAYAVGAFIGYLVLLVGLGIYSSRFSSKGLSEYFIGGRVMNRFVVSLLLGFLAEELVFWLVLFAWAGLGASIGPTPILALYWRGATRHGVMAGLVTGTIVTIVWYYVSGLSDRIYELIPGFSAALLVTWLVSIFTESSHRTVQAFEDMLD